MESKDYTIRVDAEYVAIDPLDRDAIANIDTITDLITAK